MKDIRSLEQTLATHLPWHKARVKFVAALILALVTAKTVNLVELACVFAGKAKQDSKYKKLQRFFRFFEIPYADIAALVVKLLGVDGPWTLSLDRTNWQFGAVHINLLVLGIVHQGIAYPIVWLSLDKAGNSNTDERILIMEIFLQLFGKEKIARLVGDREFVGKEWLCWLRNHGIHFNLRVRDNFQVANARGKMVPVFHLFRATRVNQALVIEQPRRMWGEDWYFSGCYLGKGEYLILVSPTLDEAAVEEYADRWEIETLFAALKTRGFCLEQTHMTDPERLERLLAMLALTFCLCHKLGEWLHEQKALKLKKHGRKPKSIFRRGFDQLRGAITNFTHFDLVTWEKLLQLLSCT
jgi:Transposase DDE domain